MPMEPIPNEMIVDQVLKAMPEVWAIYRFGSAGTPFERTDSDIDLAILSPKPMAGVARWELAQDLAWQLKRDVDVVDCCALQRCYAIRCLAAASAFTAPTGSRPRNSRAGPCPTMCV